MGPGEQMEMSEISNRLSDFDSTSGKSEDVSGSSWADLSVGINRFVSDRKISFQMYINLFIQSKI